MSSGDFLFFTVERKRLDNKKVTRFFDNEERGGRKTLHWRK